MEVFGWPLSEVLLVLLSTFILILTVLNIVLKQKLDVSEDQRRRTKARDVLLSRVAEDKNWGEVTIMSSRADEPQVYQTWIGDGNLQDSARRMS